MFDEVSFRNLDVIADAVVKWLLTTDSLTPTARAENLAALLQAENRSVFLIKLRNVLESCF